MRPEIKVTTIVGVESDLKKSLASLQKKMVYVGVPATTAQERLKDLVGLAAKSAGKRKQRILTVAAFNAINNAQLVYIHTHGSPLKGIPPRPIIEAAITDRDNLELITSELKLAAQASLSGKSEDVTKYLKRTSLLAEGLVRAWFTNPKNHWAPNAASTIARKGSDRPLIDTAELRKSIIGIVTEGQ
jgi:hypothetical protein